MILKINDNLALPHSTLNPWLSQCGTGTSSVSVTWSLLEMQNLRAHSGSRIKICFSRGSPGDLNASVGKAQLFLCRNWHPCHSCSLSVWRTPWKLTSFCPPLCLWKECQSIRDPGWRQLSTHHWSISAAFSCNYWTSLLPRCFWHLQTGFYPIPSRGQVFSQKYLFSFLLHHSIFTRMEKLWIISFSKVNCYCLSESRMYLPLSGP